MSIDPHITLAFDATYSVGLYVIVMYSDSRGLTSTKFLSKDHASSSFKIRFSFLNYSIFFLSPVTALLDLDDCAAFDRDFGDWHFWMNACTLATESPTSWSSSCSTELVVFYVRKIATFVSTVNGL